MVSLQEVDCSVEDDGGETVEEMQSNFLDSHGGWRADSVPVLQHRLPSDPFPIAEFSAARSNGSREREGERAGLRRQRREITFEEISVFFDVPIAVAAKDLNISLTQLKGKCRDLGIPYWPRLKLKNLKTLIRNLEDLAREEWKATEKPVLRVAERLRRLRREMERTPAAPLHWGFRMLQQTCIKVIARRKRRMQRDRASSSSRK